MSRQIEVRATCMRGGTRKGVFFTPDPYGKHTDGMGGAASSTGKGRAGVRARRDARGTYWSLMSSMTRLAFMSFLPKLSISGITR